MQFPKPMELGAVSKVPNRSEKVILISPQARQDLIINGLRFRLGGRNDPVGDF